MPVLLLLENLLNFLLWKHSKQTNKPSQGPDFDLIIFVSAEYVYYRLKTSWKRKTIVIPIRLLFSHVRPRPHYDTLPTACIFVWYCCTEVRLSPVHSNHGTEWVVLEHHTFSFSIFRYRRHLWERPRMVNFKAARGGTQKAKELL